MGRGGPSNQSSPQKEDYNGSETTEEKLKSTIFVLREECINFKRKYTDVLNKNQKYREKDDKSGQKKAELRAEVARLENRNTKLLQELKDTVAEIARLKERNAELEAESSVTDVFKSRIGDLEKLCEDQSQQSNANEVHFDEYIQAVEHLTSRFRKSRRLPRFEHSLPSRTTKTEHAGHPDRVILEARTAPASGQLRSKESETSQPMLTQAIKYGPERHRDTVDAEFTGKRTDLTQEAERSVYSPARQRCGESRLLTSSNGHRIDPYAAGSLECSKKRALLPDLEWSNGSEKRVRQKRHHLAPQDKATDPRLRRY